MARGEGLTIGKKYIVRAIPHCYTGELLAVTPTEIILGHAAWIAHTGKFSTALESGKLQYVEPYPDEVIVMRAVIADMSEWKHPLPRKAIG